MAHSLARPVKNVEVKRANPNDIQRLLEANIVRPAILEVPETKPFKVVGLGKSHRGRFFQVDISTAWTDIWAIQYLLLADVLAIGLAVCLWRLWRSIKSTETIG